MVQRKALNKPSFNKACPSQFEAIKNQSTNMKPYIQSLDVKAKGFNLAKKMKKSRSFKRSPDQDNLKKSSLRRHQLPTEHQPPPKQKPPGSPVKQQSQIRANSTSPNYMKSTSSSEARKEQKQVLITKTPNRSISESISRRLFCSSSSSSKSVSKFSSLSKVRTLTKAPSFKPSLKKCSKTSVCDVKRNTCSSTIKDSKFPSFLDLSPQGTSVMKVCPYNYCSLNGHRHKDAPPLKSFLCARRRMMKAQRSLKPVDAAPCKVKPCLDEDQSKEEVFVADKEDKADFFLEIYDQEKESAFTEMKIDEDLLDECVFDVGSFDWESSDMEWEEEGRIYLTGLELEDGDSTPSDYGSDQTKGDETEYLLDEGVVKKDYVNLEFLKEFLAEELSQDEITDCHEQMSDSDSSMNDMYEEWELDQFFQVDDTSLTQDMENSGSAENVSRDEEEGDSNLKKDLLPVETTIHAIQETKAEEKSVILMSEEDESKAGNKVSGNVKKNNYKKLGNGGELSSDCSSMISITKGKRNQKDESEEMKLFNPREPNFLEVEPDPESEKVDLKHQEVDERRNSEEWMLDFALRKAVTDLAPARKRKVAMLVAAFETVIPPTRSFEARLQPCN